MNESLTWQEEKEKIVIQRDRNRAQFMCILEWFELLEDNTNLLPYFKEHNCHRIAIYGAAEIGRVLLKELEKDDQIEVIYFLDKNAERQKEKWGVPVYLPEKFSQLPEVDIVIVTAITFFDSIYDTLLQIRPEIPVVSLNTIIEVRKDEVWHEQR